MSNIIEVVLKWVTQGKGEFDSFKTTIDNIGKSTLSAEERLNAYNTGLTRGQSASSIFSGALIQQASSADLTTGGYRKMIESSGLFSQAQLNSAQISSMATAKANELANAVSSGAMKARDAGAAYGQYVRDLENTFPVTNKTNESMLELSKTFAIVAAAATAIGVAGQAIYDFGRAGAELDFVEVKFGRLAESIGTTSDVLLNDLREATKGMYSDAEIMKGALDFMALGLVKSQDEVVRLTNVSSGLNMNMNQLVLTLTNMTTMRFDALGVSVDGFEAKMKSLEDQGYSTNDAFKEAFLQQAEEQLNKVGNAADENIGAFMRLEAQWKNLTDDLKEGTASAILPFVEAMAESGDQLDLQRRQVEAYNLKMIEIGGQLVLSRAQYQVLRDEIERVWREQEKAKAMTEYYSNMLEGNTETVTENAEAVAEAAQLQSEYYKTVLSGADKQYEVTQNFIEQQDNLKAKQAEVKADLDKMLDTQPWMTTSEEAQKLRDKYDELGMKIDETAQKHREKLAEMQYDLLLTQLSADGLTSAEYEMAVAAGVAFGVYDQEAAEAQISQLELTNAVADGKLSVQEYGAMMQSAMADGIVTAAELRAMIDSIPSNKSVYIDVFTRNYGSSDGGAQLVQRYAEGTDGWMTVPAGYPNDSYPILLQSGERFAVIPAGVQASPSLAGGGFGGGVNVTLVIQSPVNLSTEEQAKNVLLPFIEIGIKELMSRGAIPNG